MKPFFVGIYRGIISFQGFLGGAGFRPSTVPQYVRGGGGANPNPNHQSKPPIQTTNCVLPDTGCAFGGKQCVGMFDMLEMKCPKNRHPEGTTHPSTCSKGSSAGIAIFPLYASPPKETHYNNLILKAPQNYILISVAQRDPEVSGDHFLGPLEMGTQLGDTKLEVIPIGRCALVASDTKRRKDHLFITSSSVSQGSIEWIQTARPWGFVWKPPKWRPCIFLPSMAPEKLVPVSCSDPKAPGSAGRQKKRKKQKKKNKNRPEVPSKLQPLQSFGEPRARRSPPSRNKKKKAAPGARPGAPLRSDGAWRSSRVSSLPGAVSTGFGRGAGSVRFFGDTHEQTEKKTPPEQQKKTEGTEGRKTRAVQVWRNLVYLIRDNAWFFSPELCISTLGMSL